MPSGIYFTKKHRGVSKGNIPWNKGKVGLQKCSTETRRKISKANKGRKLSEETKRKMGLWQKGGKKPWAGKRPWKYPGQRMKKQN